MLLPRLANEHDVSEVWRNIDFKVFPGTVFSIRSLFCEAFSMIKDENNYNWFRPGDLNSFGSSFQLCLKIYKNIPTFRDFVASFSWLSFKKQVKLLMSENFTVPLNISIYLRLEMKKVIIIIGGIVEPINLKSNSYSHWSTENFSCPSMTSLYRSIKLRTNFYLRLK